MGKRYGAEAPATKALTTDELAAQAREKGRRMADAFRARGAIARVPNSELVSARLALLETGFQADADTLGLELERRKQALARLLRGMPGLRG